jgi:hypothetical protein
MIEERYGLWLRQEQKLLNLTEHLSSPQVLSGVRLARSLIFCVMFCRSLFVLCPVSFVHCIVCPSTYRFYLLLWYLQNFLNSDCNMCCLIYKHGGDRKTFEVMIGTTSSGIRINWEIYTPYAAAAGMLLHIHVHGKFTMGKMKSFLLS